MNVFIMQNSLIKPFGRDAQNALIGFVGENNSRTFFIRTRDDLTGYTVSLVIDETDCGAMTKTPMPDGSTMLTLTLTSGMLGQGGNKICQLIMANDTTVKKSSQFFAFVGLANDITQAATDSATLIVISEAITQMISDSIPPDYSELLADVDDLEDRVEALEAGGSGSGLTDAIKTALMNLVNHLAWDDDDPTGQTYITALYNALYPPAELVSISAVYTQSGTVYDTDTLDSLKSDLVITALMSDSSTRIVTEYTLSGTLAEGTSVITVTYGGKTATFNVTVSTHLMYSLYNHEFTGDPVESPYIDTGIKLFDTDFSWTIICSISREAAAANHGWRLFNALQGTTPYNGFYHGSSNDGDSQTNVKWASHNNNSVNTYMRKGFVGTYKCAFVHSKDGGLQMYFKGNDDDVITKTDNSTWTQITDAVSLGIGGVTSNNVNYAFTGTIIKLEMYDYAFGSTAINAFMEGS